MNDSHLHFGRTSKVCFRVRIPSMTAPKKSMIVRIPTDRLFSSSFQSMFSFKFQSFLIILCFFCFYSITTSNLCWANQYKSWHLIDGVLIMDDKFQVLCDTVIEFSSQKFESFCLFLFDWVSLQWALSSNNLPLCPFIYYNGFVYNKLIFRNFIRFTNKIEWTVFILIDFLNDNSNSDVSKN